VGEPRRGSPGSWQYLALWDEAGSIDLEATLATLPASDRDAAGMIAGLWPDQIFYVPGDKQWYLWDGQQLRPDSSNAIIRWIDLFTRMLDKVFEAAGRQIMAEETAKLPGDPARAGDEASKRWAGWEKSPQYKYAHGLRGKAAASLRERLAGPRGVGPEELAERHPGLLNTVTCVVNLNPAEGEPPAYRHDPALRMTYCVPTPWPGPVPGGASPLAGCPEYAQMLARAVNYDEEVFWFLIKVLGYSLLGDNRLQLIFFMTGDTNNGKSKLLEVVSTVLGDQLSYEAKPPLVCQENPHSRHEATLRGKRLVTLDETSEQLQLATNQVKRLTGQSHYSVELLYDKTMTKTPVTWLFIIPNNQMPTIADLDAAMKRRSWVLPMGPTIPEWERDPQIVPRIVATEASGVLGLLVWGCRQALENNGRALLLPPAAVVAKTEEYQVQQDTVGRWLAERCLAANGSSPQVEGRHAKADYYEWCKETEVVAPVGPQAFFGKLGMVPGVVRGGDPHHVWFRGFILKHERMD